MYSRFDDEQKNPAPDAEDLWNVPACKLPLGYGLYAPGSPASVAAGEPVRGVLERKADEGLAGALLIKSLRVSYIPGPGVLACRSRRAWRRAASAWARCAGVIRPAKL
mmetsp:Transcript_13116/g.42998  ORF Transcript_13116/g.42998 Transcript_13116/m.42998 type:complete len:108 (+) Transcript_13116:1063-1386(+)